jgi:hypothetical protein
VEATQPNLSRLPARRLPRRVVPVPAPDPPGRRRRPRPPRHTTRQPAPTTPHERPRKWHKSRVATPPRRHSCSRWRRGGAATGARRHRRVDQRRIPSHHDGRHPSDGGDSGGRGGRRGINHAGAVVPPGAIAVRRDPVRGLAGISRSISGPGRPARPTSSEESNGEARETLRAADVGRGVAVTGVAS